jgi:hypothetical protein
MTSARDFANLKFHLECAQVSLQRLQGSRLSVCGPGEIWQDEQGVLNFKLFISEGFSRFQHTCYQETKIGTLRKREDYFVLSASDCGGQGWYSPQVWPSSWQELGRDAGLVKGSFGQLLRTTSYPRISSYWVEMRFRGNLNYPPTVNHVRTETLGDKQISLHSLDGAARVVGEGYVMTFFHQESHTVVQYEGSMTPPQALALRIQEALQFCLASLVECVAESTVSAGIESEDIKLTSSRLPGGFVKGQHPPLRFHGHGNSKDFWSMFSRYFEYVSTNGCEGWHPISVRTREIIASRGVSLPSETLALAIGVEGVAKESEERLKALLANGDCSVQNQDDENNANLEEAIQIIQDELRMDSHAKNRILNQARSWLRQAPMKMVDRFLAAQQLPVELLKSWKTLRHRGAHGSGTGNLSAEDSIQLRNEVLYLFYSLVLAIIGYEGAFTDYSQPGWPATSTPPSANAPEPEVSNE